MNCAYCTSQACQTRCREGLPEDCPMEDAGRVEADCSCYHQEENQDFYADSIESMKQSFGKMPRIIEAVNFCRLRGYQKIGVAYCSGVLKKGIAVAQIFEKHGFEVVSVGCKLGGFSPEELIDDLPEPPVQGETGRPKRAICNPIGQARFLNEQKTDFNVVVGLCVGHDSLFFRYSHAPVTVVVLKDRLFPHQSDPSEQAAMEWSQPLCEIEL